jgi:hypothetical protein
MARPDPRVDPSSLPPDREGADPGVERVAVSAITAPTSDPADATEAESGVVAVSAPTPKSVTSADPRIAEVEPLVALNDWKAIAGKLGSVEDAGTLPPNLGLLAALAHNEMAKDGDQAARELSFRCVASVLGMPADSEIVRVLTGRLLRKNPVRFGERPAPPAKTSLLIVAMVLAVGAGVGWFLSSGTFNHLLHQLR